MLLAQGVKKRGHATAKQLIPPRRRMNLHEVLKKRASCKCTFIGPRYEFCSLRVLDCELHAFFSHYCYIATQVDNLHTMPRVCYAYMVVCIQRHYFVVTACGLATWVSTSFSGKHCITEFYQSNFWCAKVTARESSLVGPVPGCFPQHKRLWML